MTCTFTSALSFILSPGLDTPTLELPGSDWEALSLARTILEPFAREEFMTLGDWGVYA